MNMVKDNNDSHEKVEIGSRKPKKWTETEISRLKKFAKANADRRSEEDKVKNRLMALQYEIEANVNDNQSKPLTIEDVLRDYLDILNMPFRKFAYYLDSTDSNLRKYITGERKFNNDLALKFSHFFHTTPELWLKLQLKNELFEPKLSKEVKKYKKYDYRKVLETLN